jgi:hypothetical protein
MPEQACTDMFGKATEIVFTKPTSIISSMKLLKHNE